MLTFDSLVKKIKTKHSVTAPWFVTQNVADVVLLFWRFSGDDVIPLGVILKTISHTGTTIEFLSRKKEGGFYRYELQSKYMDRKQSELTLGAGLVSALSNQDPSHYLPHPEYAKKSRETAVVEAEDAGDEDDIDDEEFSEDIPQTQRHKKDRWDVARKSHKDKGKALDATQPKKKSHSTPQAPKEKLLGSSMVAEKTRLSRESDNDARRRKREREAMNVPTPPPKKHQSVSATPVPRKQQYVTPSPPPKKKPVDVEEVTTEEEEEEEEESESEGNDDGAGAAAVEEES
ncbi:hypothetical protein R1sor_001288 [Riccia sorocarpa]|uniref:Uncharacterized protein n=1 Tax=Riccia sorocarpa TaxID=122646 RepID=A0ABD3GXH5_9MARC